MSKSMTHSPGRSCIRLLAILLPVFLVGACASEPEIIQQTFETPEEAAEALVAAAETFDVEAMKAIFGPDGADLVVTEDPVQDRNQAVEFAAQAHEKLQVVVNPEDAKLAEVSVGVGEWPLPIPLVEDGGRWRFDSAAGTDRGPRAGRLRADSLRPISGRAANTA